MTAGHVRRALALVAMIVGAACPAWAYDGSLAAYRDHVDRYRLDWPVPDRIDWFRASDGARIRYARFAPPAGVPPRGVVVFFSGRADFVEKNAPAYAEMLRRRFEVWTLDWRGQGFSDHLLTAPEDHDKGDVDTFDRYLRDAEQFLDQIVNLPSARGTKVLLGHSMGGQLALRYLLEHPDTFDRAVLTSPLLRIPRDTPWLPWLRWGHAVKTLFGGGTACVLGGSPRWTSHFRTLACPLLSSPPAMVERELRDPETSGRYTHDWVLLARQICVIEESRGRTPDLGVACPTSRWLGAALRSTDLTMAARHRLRTPTLMIPAANDRVVANAGQVAFCDEKNAACCRAPEIDAAGHELLLERAPLRARVLALFDRFLESAVDVKTFCAGL